MYSITRDLSALIAVRISRFCKFLNQKSYFRTWKLKKGDLKLPVIREDGRVQNNLLEQLNELIRQISRHESLDSDRDVVRVLSLRQRSLDNLVNQRATELVRFDQNFRPELRITAFHQVTSKRLEQRVLVANGDQFFVALSAFVSDAGQVRITFFAVFADNT